MDDWLIRARSAKLAEENTKTVLKLVEDLGFVINLEKPELEPTQQIVYLGASYVLQEGIVRPAEERIVKLQTSVCKFLNKTVHTARVWQEVIDLLVTMEKLVPGGRLRIRPLQFELAKQWKQGIQDQNCLVKITQEVVQAVEWWSQLSNVQRGAQLTSFKRDSTNFHRRIPDRLGWSHGKFGDQRSLEARGTQFAHKCLGVESGAQYSTTVQRVPATQGGFSSIGQHNSSSIHSETGWNEVKTSVSGVTGAVSYSRGQRHGDQGQTCSIATECVGRRIIQKKRDSKHRMVVAPPDFRGDLEVDRTYNDRVIRDETQQQDAHVCLADTGRESLESGCLVHKLERNVCVCISSDNVNRPSVDQDSAIQVSDSIDSTNVAKTSVVCAVTGVIDRDANKVTSMKMDVEAAEVIDKTRKSSNAQFTCVDLIKRHWKEKGFSETAADRMARAQKEFSRAVYQGKWRILH